MRSRNRFTIVVVVAAWLLLGPVGMAFDTCGAMMALCEIPCGAPSALMDLTPTPSPLTPVALLAATSFGHPPLPDDTALDPPPELALSI